MGGKERGGELASGRARPVRQRHCLLPPRSLGWGLGAGARPAAAIPAQRRPARGPAPARGGTQPRPGEVSPRINFSPPPPPLSPPFPPPRSLALFPVAPAQPPPCRRLGPRAPPCPAAPRREARRAEEGMGGKGGGRHPPWRADGGRVPPGERRARGPRSDGEASSRRGKLKLLTAASAELRGAGGAGRRGDRWGPRVPLSGSARLRRRFSMRAAATPCPRTLMGRGGIVDRLRLRPEGCHLPSLQLSWGRNKAGWEAARNLSPLKCCAWYTASEALLGECCQ